MNTVHINASKEYDVLIGPGLLDRLGSCVAAMPGVRKVCIVSDSNVWPLYGQAAVQSLDDAGLEQVWPYIFPAGEASKNGNTYLELLNHLALHRLTRSDAIIALGGGVVGDLAGFAAATFLRGIRFVQVPTTLLAAVDSSVGGKTAIDLPAGKNLAGTFYQPSLVLCDTDTLNTLPEDIFRDGCAEVIKYAILYDPQLFSHLDRYGLSFHREDVITRCVELKRDVVAQDEFDTGARMKLNLGHTVGHGIEAASGFAVSHGTAVAMGTAIVTRSSEKLGCCASSVREAVEALLQRFGLPLTCDFSADELCRHALSDKKRSGGHVNLILPERIGFCRIQKTPVDSLLSFIEAGL